MDVIGVLEITIKIIGVLLVILGGSFGLIFVKHAMSIIAKEEPKVLSYEEAINIRVAFIMNMVTAIFFNIAAIAGLVMIYIS